VAENVKMAASACIRALRVCPLSMGASIAKLRSKPCWGEIPELFSLMGNKGSELQIFKHSNLIFKETREC
jgi:hypothetical protein